VLYKCTHYYYFYYTRLTASFPTQKGKTSLDLNEARDDGVLGCSGISKTIRKQSAPRSRQITTPTPHNLFFTGRTLFLTPNQQRQSTSFPTQKGKTSLDLNEARDDGVLG